MSEDKRYIFDNDIDKRMEEALDSERERLNAKDMRRRKQRNHRRMILAFLVLLIAVFVVIGLLKVLSTNDYSNEEQFTDFADSALAENQICTPEGDAVTEYSYDSEFSIAIRKDNIKNDEIEGFRERKINSIIESADREESNTLIIDTSTYKTGNGAVSMLIQYYQYKKEGRNLVLSSSHADTYLFKAGTGDVLDPLQVLNVNYKDKAEEFASEYMTKTYNDSKRSDNYEDYIIANDQNYNNFIMTGNEIIFLFELDTVLKDSPVVTQMAVPYMFIETAIRPETLDRYIDESRPMVAITYDDGPGGESEARILQCLSDNSSVATFFSVGYRLSSNSENAQWAVRIGCEIGNHSWDHPTMSSLSKDEIVNQIKKTNSKIEDICGVDPVVARPPYGDFNKNVLESCGMAEVLWTVDTKDWATRDAEMTFEAIKKQKDLDGKIILMHSIYDETADATEMIIPWLKEQGYQTVTVSELIKYKTGTTPKAGKLYRKLQ
ncbi:MAG: polysaccharide deacetylase family protein [Bacillota bacterium]|nr:polysaccharide deacetylase family protein [Bacillota bacterium]